MRWTRRFWFGPLFALAAVAFALWLIWPNYLLLQIPVAEHSGRVEFWSDPHDTQLGDTAYVRRLTGEAEPAVHWRTVDEAFGFFEQWLTERGWKRGGDVVQDPILPESWFLPPENMRQ
jgi:hypothetical protein